MSHALSRSSLFSICMILALQVNSQPSGFQLETLTNDVPNARQMAVADDGTIFVGSRGAGTVYAVKRQETGVEVIVVDSGLTMPTGVAVFDGDLYVSEIHQILRYANILSTFEMNPVPEVVADDLPRARAHGWKYLSFGPDNHLYFNVGAPCNICESEDPRFASIMRMDPLTGISSVYAHGVRNSVGIDWHPVSHLMWFSDNGRDWLGDDIPAEEINVVSIPGQHFGYPYLHASNLLDPVFGRDAKVADYEPPVVEIQAHSAAIGVTFYDKNQFPEEFHNALFIAEHGSWNRSKKVGARVSVVTNTTGDAQPTYAPFVDRWLVDDEYQGRPADVEVTHEGALLISDDLRGAIYEVTYSKN